MQAGFGWETIVMSRRHQLVGTEPGRYLTHFHVSDLPLEPGSYQLSLQLGMPDPEVAGRFIGLDNYGWLSGNGIEVQVVGKTERLLTMPSQWSVSPQ
jgi:hypothetical protein